MVVGSATVPAGLICRHKNSARAVCSVTAPVRLGTTSRMTVTVTLNEYFTQTGKIHVQEIAAEAREAQVKRVPEQKAWALKGVN